ncbi:MAG: hypothetical protein HN509_14810 [Halobacteriovoraceae bacterium]|nr:hypothetical protein [Halobacteriovoraceae bacterium]
MKSLKIWLLLLTLATVSSCGGFKAKRQSGDESDEAAMEVTDKWVSGDTERVVKDIIKHIGNHKGFKRYLRGHGGSPTVFIGEVKNLTAEAYFPINDINDEFLNEISASGDFVLVDAAAREQMLKEITYQHDGMVDPKTAAKVGNQTGAQLMIFGNIYMKPRSRKGKTIKQYSVNIRMTNLSKGTEVLRVRTKLNKFSEKGGAGW